MTGAIRLAASQWLTLAIYSSSFRKSVRLSSYVLRILGDAVSRTLGLLFLCFCGVVVFCRIVLRRLGSFDGQTPKSPVATSCCAARFLSHFAGGHLCGCWRETEAESRGRAGSGGGQHTCRAFWISIRRAQKGVGNPTIRISIFSGEKGRRRYSKICKLLEGRVEVRARCVPRAG